MARKIENPAAPKADTQSSMEKALDDLYVLHPDIELEVAGRKLTIGEYRLFDGMTARAKGAPLIDDLEAMTRDATAADAGIEAYLDLLSKHRALTRELMLLSILEQDRDVEFIDSLKGPDAERLLMTWWGACSRFFWRAVVGRTRDRTMAKLRKQAARNGQTSSTPSHAPDTAAAATSDASTPSAS